MATYLIKSVQTGRLVTTLSNEVAGDPVNTYFGSTLLTFRCSLDGSETFTSIKGDSGLYINPGPGNERLIWSESEFFWLAALIDSTESHYQLIAANGQDLYWTQNTSDKYYIPLLPGNQATGNEGIWKIYSD